MDTTQLDYPDNFFDIIIDKSTLDCIQCNVDAKKLIKNTMVECQRVLKPSGYFISISFTEPISRLKHI